MAETVGVRELRQNLSRYLILVKAGESLTVTERGQEVARVVPLKPGIDPVYRRLAEKYGATIPQGDLVEASRSLRAERDRPGAPAGTTDAYLAADRRERA